MKQLLIVVLVIAEFSCEAFAQTVAPDAIDNKVAALKVREQDIEKALTALAHNYSAAVAAHNLSGLDAIVDQVKVQNGVIAKLRGDIESEILAVGGNAHFYQHFEYDLLGIQVRKYGDAFKAIALEILGYRAGVSNFPSYYHSKQLQTDLELLTAKLVAAVMGSYQIGEVMKKFPLGEPDEAGKKEVLQSLDAVISATTKAAELLIGDYSQELIKVASQGQDLELVQKNTIEALIEQLYGLADYAQVYKETFVKLNGTGSAAAAAGVASTLSPAAAAPGN